LITAILNPLWRLGNSMSSAPIESSSKYTRTAMALISFVSQPAQSHGNTICITRLGKNPGWEDNSNLFGIQ
ncbi:hypothetical protein ACQ4N7_29920, partial [Nodosilinea sp. AN01ver1]|uniref:hypothetical protein n=1 Tax=Nodosilinea sp. AN01ver1 TaxID=3423362 RepID=UPI003D313313